FFSYLLRIGAIHGPLRPGCVRMGKTPARNICFSRRSLSIICFIQGPTALQQKAGAGRTPHAGKRKASS
ncbi:hypothetical protein, partial [Paracandidimonas soli]|uniref:hypothetical protein n=1 Tax=Paracandidimonas soli TaxID=1917182 RepID=UPI0033421A86